jgi:8-oxo-dGTP diphosphatase
MDKGLIVHTIIFNEKKEILVIRRSQSNDVLPGSWDIPGGTLEDGESPQEGAAREALEETGLEVRDPHLFFCWSNVDTDKNKQFVTLVFLVKYAGGKIELNPEEHDDFTWMNPFRAEDYHLVDYLKDCLDLLSSHKHSLLEF